MGLLSNVWQRLIESVVDNRQKLTATGGFVLGVLVTLGFKDFYPDLENAWRARLRRLRGNDALRTLPDTSHFVSLEDHSRRKSTVHARDAASSRTQPAEHYEIRDGVEGLIGNTPLIRLKGLSEATGCEILAKAEFLNGAGNSPKDRVAMAMIDGAEADGLLQPGRGDTVYEGTVGSTGISLAAVCRARGYKAHICMPDDQANEKVELLKRLGATVERVRPASIIDEGHFVNVARRRAVEHSANEDSPGHGLFADQFENSANFEAHRTTTGPEIIRQTDGQLDYFVAGAGTGGTISGVALTLKKHVPHVRIVLADPQGSGLFNRVRYGVMFSPTESEGTRRRHQVDSIVEGIGLTRLTANFEAGMHLIDDAVRVTDVQAMRMARWLVENEGLFVGGSSSVNCAAAVQVARNAAPGSRIVTVLCDSGTRHLSRFWRTTAEQASEDGGLSLDDVFKDP